MFIFVDTLMDVCCICKDDLNDIDSGSSLVSIDCCKHRFHRDCIEPWSLISNTCPLCKTRFSRIIFGRLSKKVSHKDQVPDNSDLIADQFHEETTPCQICNDDNDEHLLLICDGCDLYFHTFCLNLPKVPSSDPWYCPACCKEKNLVFDKKTGNHFIFHSSTVKCPMCNFLNNQNASQCKICGYYM